MKIIIGFLSFFLAFSMSSQSLKSDIKEIRKSYKEIVKNKDYYIKKSTDLMGGSSEGGHAIAYFNNETIILTEVTWYGEMGKTARSYYYNDRGLFFVYEQVFTYNAPMYSDFFNNKETSYIENRYYYKNNELIRILDPTKKELDITLKEIKENGSRLLKEALDLKNEFVD